MLLLDRSASMMGSKTNQVERACKVLAQALKFPFVDLTIWGFQSLEDGQVDITRYDPTMRSFSTTNPVGGGTPLHIATRLAHRHLTEGDQSKHLIVLTDGFPAYALRNHKLVPPSQLMKWTRQEIKSLRKKNISVTGVFLGSEMGNKVEYELTPEQLSHMFGPRRYWRLMQPKRLGTDLVKLVSSSFLAYLNHG